jgi:H+/Cl- antiporter ClcA
MDRRGRRTMGKLANNEAIKLEATFFNSSAVAAAVAGYLVPTLFVVQKLLDRQFSASSELFDPWQFLPVLICAMLAGYLSVILRRKARKIIRELED